MRCHASSVLLLCSCAWLAESLPTNYVYSSLPGATYQIQDGQNVVVTPFIHPSLLPVAQGQLPVSQAQLPIVRGQLPVPRGQLPVPGGQLPVPRGQLPVPGGQLPVPRGQLPVSQGQLLVSHGQFPAAVGFPQFIPQAQQPDLALSVSKAQPETVLQTAAALDETADNNVGLIEPADDIARLIEPTQLNRQDKPIANDESVPAAVQSPSQVVQSSQVAETSEEEPCEDPFSLDTGLLADIADIFDSVSEVVNVLGPDQNKQGEKLRKTATLIKEGSTLFADLTFEEKAPPKTRSKSSKKCKADLGSLSTNLEDIADLVEVITPQLEEIQNS